MPRLTLSLAVAASLAALPALAQQTSPPLVPAPGKETPAVEASTPPPPAVDVRSIGVHVAVNVGVFSLDVQAGRLYAFAAGSLGVPLLSDGRFGAFALGGGLALPISAPGESMWTMDLFALANPGWGLGPNSAPFVGLGVGAGFRYLHRSGFTFGLKLPVIGGAVNGGASTPSAVGTFYLANLIALPGVSFGYRF